ncbi:MAG: hypothetical protein KKE59_01940, partial [Proteobacteria bacterium]|nr:hypothetical protein [Pseudomonadota bacterium]
EKDFFIATSEKAFIDAIYLTSLGRYNLDLASIDIGKFKLDELYKITAKFSANIKMVLDSILH